jgi:hypothetical protein
MFERITSLPPGVIGVAAHGMIGAADRRSVLEASLRRALRAGQGRVRLLYAIAADFDGYDHGELYDDAVFGTRHFNDFDGVAFVAADGRHRRAVEAMVGLFPWKLRVFRPDAADAATAWLDSLSAEAGEGAVD